MLIEDIPLPFIVVVREIPMMSTCFHDVEDIAREAQALLDIAQCPCPPLQTVSEALRLLCIGVPYMYVSKSHWSASQAKRIGDLFGLMALETVLTMAQREGWPMHGLAPRDASEGAPAASAEDRAWRLMGDARNWLHGMPQAAATGRD